MKVRSILNEHMGADSVQFLSITLDAPWDTVERMAGYAKSYQIENEAGLPRWLFLSGKYAETERLRRSMGVYDLDPVVDADKTQHSGIVTFGNDRTDRWAALPSEMDAAQIVEAMIRVAGRTQEERDRSLEAVKDSLFKER